MSHRREFLLECGKAFAALMLTAACEQEKLFRPRGKSITPDFFGHMIQGDWVTDDGSLCCTDSHPVTVYFGLLRLWDSRAVWWKMVNDPQALSATLRYAESVGADAMFVFGQPPQSAVMPGKSQMPTREAWGSFVKEIARERIRYVELWNEPAEPGSWDGTPEELVDYCRIAYPILAATGKTVLSPSITRVSSYAFADRFLAAGGGEWCDEIAFHGYGLDPGFLSEDINSVRGLLRKHRVSRPIRNTEYAVIPTDPSLRSAYMAQSLLIQASLGVSGVVWDPEPTEAANDYTDDTMRVMADLLIGSTVGPISVSGNVSRCVVSKGSVDTELVWTEGSFPMSAMRAAA